MDESLESYPLPENPVLAEVAAALRDTGHWGLVVDQLWRLAYGTDELRLTFGAGTALAPLAIGKHLFGPEQTSTRQQWRFGPNSIELSRVMFAHLGGWVLADVAGSRDRLRDLVDPALHDIIEELTPADPAALSFTLCGAGFSHVRVDVPLVALRIRDSDGRLAGTVLITKPAAGMATLGAMASMADLGHLQRMQSVLRPARRPSAVLFADLEASSLLSRRLSSASYFALGRRLTRAADQCVIDAGGLVGRHVGDGVAAFFLAETAGSESAAVRACIEATRALKSATGGVATRSDLQPEDIVMRFGLHWGSTLYVGSITTAGRGEVTALGDEVNEAARIEACASGGRALASKDLIERLEPDDAAALDLDPRQNKYTALADLPTATEKARRDAPALAVCEI